jgi:hypothetical protein
MTKLLFCICFIALCSCNSSTQHNFVGNWTGCGYNKGDQVTITKDGENFIFKKNGKGELILTKQSDNILSGMGGLVTLRYDESMKKLIMGDGGPQEEYCK